MKPVAFDYVRAESREEVLELLAEAGDDAVLLAGGMSLGPMLNFRMATPTLVIDLNRVPGLDAIQVNGTATTGAMLRQARAMREARLMEAVPLLSMALPWVGHIQTRNRGTLGGSAAHADPSAEIPLCLVTLGGSVSLATTTGERQVPAAEFFQGVLATAKAEDEMITALHWPTAGSEQGFAFAEEARRHGDFALAAAAAKIEIDRNGNLIGGTLGLAGIGERPAARDLESWAGATLDPSIAKDIAAAASGAIDAMDDHVADATYRRHLAQWLGTRVLLQASAAARGAEGNAS